MLGELKALSRETLIYGLSTVVGRGLNFLLLPLYTHALLPAEYGIVATVFSYLAFLNILYGYGMDFSFMRYYDPRNPQDAHSFFSTAFWSVFLIAALFSLALAWNAGAVCRVARIPQTAVVVCSAAILASDALALLPFARLRMNHQAGLYAGLKILNITVNIVLNYVFLFKLKSGFIGVFWASLAASLATLIPALMSSIRELSFIFSLASWARLLKFGLPLVPAGLAAMAVQVIDRPILQFMTDSATVGIYQANYRLAILMMMLVNMFDTAWRPFFLQKSGRDSQALLARVLTYFAAAALFVFLGITFFAAYAVTTPIFFGKSLIQSAYWSGLSIVPVVTLGYLFDGLYVNFLAPVALAEKSGFIAYAAGLGALVNVAANWFWIPHWGMTGAAYATLAAYAAMAAFLYISGRRAAPIRYEWGRLIRLAGVAAAIMIVARGMGLAVRADHWALRLMLLAAFPIGLVLSGFFNEEERRALKSFVG